jgi:hypothetical protein
MRRSPLAFSLFVFAAAAGLARAAELPLPLAPTHPLPKKAVRPDVAHQISTDTSAKLTAAAPKFVATTTTTEEPLVAAPGTDLREIDKPRNQILRLPAQMLPPYIVEENRLPKLKERDVLTFKGRRELAFKRRPGLRFLSLPIPLLNNVGIALFMLEEDFAAERRREEADLWGLYNISDGPGSGVRVKDKLPDRPREWIDFGGPFQVSRQR